MSRMCTSCAHPERAAIDAAIVAGGRVVAITRDYGLPYGPLSAHAREHVLTRVCSDCGIEKPRAAFSRGMWHGGVKDRACLDCVQKRLARVKAWHATQHAEQEERLRRANEYHAAWELARAEYLARVPAIVRRRRQAR